MNLKVLTRSYRGEEQISTVPLEIPASAPRELSVLVSDGRQLNAIEQRELFETDALVIAAGRGGKPGESRLDLLRENAGIRNSNWGPPLSYAANLGRDRIIEMSSYHAMMGCAAAGMGMSLLFAFLTLSLVVPLFAQAVDGGGIVKALNLPGGGGMSRVFLAEDIKLARKVVVKVMPPALEWLTYLVPARYFLVMLRSILLKGLGPAAFWEDLVALAVFASLMLALASVRLRRDGLEVDQAHVHPGGVEGDVAGERLVFVGHRPHVSRTHVGQVGLLGHCPFDIGRLEGVGPITLGQVRRFLADTNCCQQDAKTVADKIMRVGADPAERVAVCVQPLAGTPLGDDHPPPGAAAAVRVRQSHDPDRRDNAGRRVDDRLWHFHRVGRHCPQRHVALLAHRGVGRHRRDHAARRSCVRRARGHVSSSGRAVRLSPRVDGSTHGFPLWVDSFHRHSNRHDRRGRSGVRPLPRRSLAGDHSRSVRVVPAGGRLRSLAWVP